MVTYPLSDGTRRQQEEGWGGETSPASPTFRFGRFTVSPSARSVFFDGRPVEVGGRAFDLLIVLLKSRGSLVTKREIVKHVWPSTVVDDSNLRFQMASLRKALGDANRDVIKTIPGRGYLFVAEAISPLFAPAFPMATPEMPAAVAARSAGTRKSASMSGAQQPMTPATVVIIDDDLAVREALECLLRSTGLRVESFSSVPAYFSCRRETPPACLILDIWLPGGSGLDFQTKLATGPLHPPVIFISGNADVAMSVRAMKAGAVEFLTKPVRHEELLSAVALAIGTAAP